MLAIETILGALTGYFTNDIAIRQLFAKKWRGRARARAVYGR